MLTFVHGEEDEGERLKMERALSEDESLRDELARTQRADDALRTFMPGLAHTDEELDRGLENEILEEWERSMTVTDVQSSAQRDVIESDFSKEARPAPSRRWWYRAAIGLAACALIAIGLQVATAPTLVWQSPRVIPMEYRGEDTSAATSVYTAQRLEAFAATLRSAIQDHYDAGAEAAQESRRLFKRQTWRARITVREIAEGALEVRVEAFRRAGSPEPLVWNEEFESAGDLSSRAEAFGARIARELTAPIEGFRR